MRRNLVAAIAIALVATTVVTAAPAAGVPRRLPPVKDWNHICNASARVPDPTTLEYADYAEGVNCRYLWVDGVVRHYVAYVPASVAASATPVPVVFMLHGTSGTGEEFYEKSRWREVADRDGFVAVFPTASRYRLRSSPGKRTTKWTHFGFPCLIVPFQDVHDDLEYLDEVLRNIADSEQVDTHRVYASGFSAGSQMVHRLALARPGVFAAVAGGSAFIDDCDQTVTVPVNPGVPVFAHIGSRDDRFVEEGDNVPPDAMAIDTEFGDPLDRLTAAHALDRNAWTELDFATWNGWTPPNPQWPAAQWTLLEFATPTAGNATGNRLVFGLIQHVGHIFPSAWDGDSNQSELRTAQWTTMADVHWTFFQQHVHP